MKLPIATIAACLLSNAAWAQADKVWTAAPVPNASRQTVAPADRAGSTAGSDTSSPFSALPSGARSNGQPTSTTRDGGGPGTDSVTPNLSK